MLTRSQQKTLDFIRDFIAREDHAPTLSEIAAGIGIQSKGVVHRYVQALSDAGEIELLAGRHRGIQLVAQGGEKGVETAVTLPLLGKIAAGLPIEAIPDQNEIDLTEFFIGNNQFVLKVQGDSMVDAGILSGDMVVVRSCNTARDGEIVVALIDGEEATLKRIKQSPDGTITLIPANRAMRPMIFPAGRVQIQGVVSAQLRSYR
ncbi:repressor LexA [Solemya pervernicosa gill symbiont]|uniref:LexA repressor n=2 Tax=Gammaproteobacteria incertae sedis TaxID=118884 RepID=A0A1T2L450_9GAMM|nr:transcriptional repressor LexA [Candidatus Reidiella endopervernicosa]OOZ39716.1 repressor LexA [Solemya pervernicosa gill symbiont]QKQ26868.1 transcriptional repressor LexA [Candidatus Reidiella endopervernicosa]